MGILAQISENPSLCSVCGYIFQMGTDNLPCDEFVISVFRELPSGGHIYNNIPGKLQCDIIGLLFLLNFIRLNLPPFWLKL